MKQLEPLVTYELSYAVGKESDLCQETKNWIAKHDKADAARRALKKSVEEHERQRSRVLSKLSLDDRHILGL